MLHIAESSAEITKSKVCNDCPQDIQMRNMSTTTSRLEFKVTRLLSEKYKWVIAYFFSARQITALSVATTVYDLCVPELVATPDQWLVLSWPPQHAGRSINPITI
jgi:hypothetical protein